MYYMMITFITTYCDLLSNLAFMTLAVLVQQIVIKRLQPELDIDVLQLCAALLANALVSLVLHIGVMHAGRLYISLRQKVKDQEAIIDIIQDGIIILNQD